jgi:thioesterase domain-containing protein
MFSKFLEELKQKEIKVTFSEGKIKYSGPVENITPEFIKKLKIFKGDLIRHCWPDECNDMISINPGGTKTPIILIYCNNIIYTLSNYLGPEQPVYGFFDKGWLTGEKNMYNSVESIARDYIIQLKKIMPHGPYLIGGHSLGGNLAYEIAIQLRNAGNDVPLLFFLDSKTDKADKPFDWSTELFHIYRRMLRPVIKKLWQYAKMPVFNGLYLMVSSLPVSIRHSYIVTNYLLLLYKYKPGKYNGDILLFRAQKDSTAHKFDFGWGDFVNKVTFVNLECTHATIVKGKENIEAIGKGIEEYLLNCKALERMIS